MEVTLYWSPGDGPTVEIHQVATGEVIVFPVAPEHALDAYYHPLAHLEASVLVPVPAGWS
jgi:hypothetical protein